MTESESVALPLGDAAIFFYTVQEKSVIKIPATEYFVSIAKLL